MRRGSAVRETARLAVLALLLLPPVLVALWPASPAEFVFDEKQYVLENAHVRTGLTPENVGWAFTEFFASNWHPLTWVSHLLDVEIWGMAAHGHRVTNLALHLANTALLFLVLRALTGAAAGSWVVAALFGLHPLHVESVAWVAERKDVLSTLFGLLAVGAHLRHARRPGRWTLLPVVALAACSLMAKPMLVTLPFVLLLLDFWPLGRLGPAGLPGRRPGAALPALILEKAPLLVLAAASSAVTYAAQRQALVALVRLPLDARLSNALVSYARYCAKILLPVDLAAFYPYPREAPWGLASLGAGLLVLSATLAVLALARRRPYLPVGWLWFAGTLVPVLGLVQVGGQSMADRYTYVPAVGLFLAAVWLAGDAAAGWRRGRRLLTAAAALALLTLAAMAGRQTGYWRNGETLFRHAVAAVPANWVAHYQLGLVLTEQGRYDEAAEHYREFIRLNPADASAEYNIGTTLLLKGRPDQAAEHFRKALRLKPGYLDPRVNLGAALLGLGRFEEARQQLAAALDIEPRSVGAHVNMGIALTQMGRGAEAVAHLREAARLDPSDARAQAALEKLLAAGERGRD